MTNFNDFLNQQLKNPDLKKEYDALEPNFSIIHAILESGLNRKDLAEKTGIAQRYISRIENGNANPLLNTLKRLAGGMGMKLKIEFVPSTAKH